MDKQGIKSTALLVTSIGTFLTPFQLSALNVALKAIGDEFSMSVVLLGWVSSIYLLVAAIFLLPFGKIADVFGRKRIFFWGLGILSVTSGFCVIAPNALLLIIFRGFQGIGAALIFATTPAIISSVFPPGERGKALGILAAVTYFGLSLGSTLGGVLIDIWGWRSIFGMTMFFGIITLLFALWKLEGEWVVASRNKFDWKGSFIYSLSLTGIMVGFPRLANFSGIALVLAGILGLASFVYWEMNFDQPIFEVDLFKGNPVFTFSTLTTLISYTPVTAVGFLLRLYLQHILGMSTQKTGLILLVQPAVMVFVTPISGRLSDRIEIRLLASLGMTFTTIGLIPMIFLNTDSSIRIIILSLIMLGIGSGFFVPPNMNAIMSGVKQESYGVLGSILGTMRLVGQTLSLGIVTMVFSFKLGQNTITQEVYAQFLASNKSLFVIFSALSFLGIFTSMVRGKVICNLPR